jgi:glucose-6-phosphate isomerase
MKEDELKLTLDSGFTFDYHNVVGPETVQKEEVEAFAPQIAAAAAAVQKIRTDGVAKNHLSKDGAPEAVYFPRLPYIKEGYPNSPSVIADLKKFGEDVRSHYDAAIFCGIGGSFLGGKVLYDCFESLYWPKDAAAKRPQIFFAGNNLDPEAASETEEAIMKMAADVRAKEKRNLKVMLVPISKSGTTLEAMYAFLYFYGTLTEEGKSIDVGVTVVSDRTLKTCPLIQLAAQYNWPVFQVPHGVGGRFSVLSTPGLIVAAALGMDIDKLLTGARDMDKACLGDDVWKNPALLNATLKYLARKNHGCTIEVFMPYAMRLKALGEWYVQLLAESLGKRKDREGNTVFYGRTPVLAIGTTDMHSQTQLHQDGIRDKVVQFLFVKNRLNKMTVHNPFPQMASLNGYEGLDLGTALNAAMEANEEALAGDHRMNALYVLPSLDEYYLGQIFYFLMLSIAYEGELADVDAFDQPGVEVYKRIMKGKVNVNR